MDKFTKYALTLLLLPLSCSAAFIPEQRCPGDIAFDVEWLYFSPVSESHYFVLQGTSQEDFLDPSTRHANRFDDFYSGYRVGVAYEFCGCDRFVSASWTAFQIDHSRSIAGPVLFSTDSPFFGGSTFASDRRQLNYYAVEAVLGQRAYECCNMSLDLFVGAHYTHLFRRDNTFFITPDATGGPDDNNFLTFRSQFWGVGPEIGIHVGTPVWNNFAINVTGTGALIPGKPRSSYEYEGSDPAAAPRDTQNDRAWRLVPYANIRVGLNYGFCWDSFSWCRNGFRGSLELGYEAFNYFNAFSVLNFPTAAVGLPNVQEVYQNFAMHGPYLALNFNF